MPETSGINAGGGIQNVGSKFSHEIKYESYRTNKKHNAVKLHLGEVVHGNIIEVISNKEAIVRLPIGTLSAELKGNLKKDDSLFFLVEELEPSLILKIHSVSVRIDGKELSIKEIIRILNLKDNPFTKSAIEFLKTKKNTIQRNEVILLNNNFNKIKNLINNNLRLNNLLESLYLILKANIKISNNIFSKIQPFFLNIDFFNKDFQNLISSIPLLPKELSDQISEFSNKLTDNSISIKEKFLLLNALKIDLPNKKSLYNILNELSEFLKKKPQSGEFKTLVKSIENIQSFLDSQAINNFILSNLQNQFYFVLPYIKQGKISFVKILFSYPKDKTGKTKKLHFSFEIITENLDTILVKGSSYNKQLNTGIYVKTDDIKDYLSKDLELLKRQLVNDSFLVQSLIIANVNDKDITGLENNKPSSNKGFSVVI